MIPTACALPIDYIVESRIPVTACLPSTQPNAPQWSPNTNIGKLTFINDIDSNVLLIIRAGAMQTDLLPDIPATKTFKGKFTAPELLEFPADMFD